MFCIVHLLLEIIYYHSHQQPISDDHKQTEKGHPYNFNKYSKPCTKKIHLCQLFSKGPVTNCKISRWIRNYYAQIHDSYNTTDTTALTVDSQWQDRI